MTASHITTFSLVDELRAKVRSLEAAGAELARSEERWKQRALSAERRLQDALEASDVCDTIVDQSAEIRRLQRERDAAEKRFLAFQDALGKALGNWQGQLLDATVEAIRQAKKQCSWPRRYHP